MDMTFWPDRAEAALLLFAIDGCGEILWFLHDHLSARAPLYSTPFCSPYPLQMFSTRPNYPQSALFLPGQPAGGDASVVWGS